MPYDDRNYDGLLYNIYGHSEYFTNKVYPVVNHAYLPINEGEDAAHTRLQKYKVSTGITSPFLLVGLLSSKVYTDYTPDNPNNQ